MPINLSTNTDRNYTHNKNLRTYLTIFIAVAAHLMLFLIITINPGKKQQREDTSIFKIVEVQEIIPPEIQQEEEIEIKQDEVIIQRQDAIAEDVIETDKEVREVEINYLPQHMISELPVPPINEIKSRIIYPPLAQRQGIEGVVFLELYIDQNGELRNIVVLRDPGYGFAESAISALQGIKFIPAKSNGVPVAVKYRYPFRFALK